jgi:endonuclease III
MKLTKALDRLEAQHGKLEVPQPSDAYEMLLHRNCGYPQSDERCDKGFRALKEQVGVSCGRILEIEEGRLGKILRESGSGMVPEQRARRLKEIAAMIESKFDGNLKTALKGKLTEARKVLKQFPTIGDSGADKILLFSGAIPVAAIPGNGVRVPLRIGFGEETKNYAESYRAAQEYVDAEIPRTFSARRRAYLLLKKHGEEICRTKPLCEECAVSKDCVYFRRMRSTHG